MTVREKALELLHEVSGLLEQLLGEVRGDQGPSADPEENVEPEATSDPVPPGDCPTGGDHEEIDIGGHVYCQKCNAPLALEEAP